MENREFNLLKEKWIRVLNFDGEVEELSIYELFENAEKYKSLSGELKMQDVSIMRLLLAILYATYGKREDGTYLKLEYETKAPETKKDIMRRWQYLWFKKAFQISDIKNYLSEYEDEFFLFHPTKPFYQVNGIDKNVVVGGKEKKISTEYGASKLNGEILKSGNKARIFSNRDEESEKTLTFSEAARWLIYLMNCDDASLKPQVNKGTVSPGVGFLGKLGLVYLSGDNLFETLMLNFVMRDIEGVERPYWAKERAEIKTEEDIKKLERIPIKVPDNQAEHLTIQSRRVLLKREEDEVTGFFALGGDYYPDDVEILIENMTAWRYDEKGKRKYNPKMHRPEIQLWREFSSIVSKRSGNDLNPGVVDWYYEICDNNFIREEFAKRKNININIAAIVYSAKKSSVDEMFSDTLTLNENLFTKIDGIFLNRIEDEVEWTKKLVDIVANFKENLILSEGLSSESAREEKAIARGEAYFRIDLPFRKWVFEIDPEVESDFDVYADSWRNTAKDIILRYGKELFENTSPNGYIGRNVKLKYNKGKKNAEEYRLFTAPKMFNVFRGEVYNHMKGSEKEIGKSGKEN